MRVLQVLGRTAGGVGRHVAELVAGLDDTNGFEIDIASHPGSAIAMPKPTLDLRIPEGPVVGHRAAIARIRELSSAGGYDVVHAHGLRAGLDAALARRDRRPGLVLTMHNLVRPEIAGSFRALLYRRTEPIAARRADKTIAVSAEIARHLLRYRSVPPARVEVVYARAATPSVSRSVREVRSWLGLGDERLIVTVSRLGPQKDLGTLLEAVARLGEGVVVAIVGEGPEERSLRRRAAKLGIEERVRFLGFRDDAGDLVSAADVFCLSSVWEAVALAAQEAILLDTPVVSTAVGGMPELIEDRTSGRLVPARDPEALAAALDEVLTTDAGSGYAAAAKAAYVQRFSTAHMLERIAAIYREVAGS